MLLTRNKTASKSASVIITNPNEKSGLNEASLEHIVQRIRVVQDVLEQRIVLENPSTYARFADGTMNEWEFISEMAELADCGLLMQSNTQISAQEAHRLGAYPAMADAEFEQIISTLLIDLAAPELNLLEISEAEG